MPAEVSRRGARLVLAVTPKPCESHASFDMESSEISFWLGFSIKPHSGRPEFPTPFMFPAKVVFCKSRVYFGWS